MRRQVLALGAGLKAMKHRDLSFIDITDEEFLVTACDSCGGIGQKKGDIVKAPCYIVGKFTVRVCLMEMLSVNAIPIGMTVNICNEPEPTGSEIIRGIRDELGEIDIDIPLTISTEKNMETSMTALGVTLFGRVKRDRLLLGRVETGDYVYILGEPLIGEEVLNSPEKACSSKDILELLKYKSIKEIIPVGSGGVGAELDKFLKETGFEIEYNSCHNIDMVKSGGPNTVSIIIAKDAQFISGGFTPRELGRIR